MRIEWWYDDATFHYSGDTDLYLARLTVDADGTAEILMPSERLPLAHEDAANEWLANEEFSLLESLTEAYEELGKPVDPRIKPPCASCDRDLLSQMVIKLG